MEKEQIRALIGQMTLEEKASLCSGEDFWHTKAIKRLGIQNIMVSDGPHGLRKQDEEGDHLGANDSIKAVCFPAGCGAAASFNRDLIRHMGSTIGKECQAVGVGVVLGPAVNVKRSPLCGRNFEYYSEDPYLATEIATSMIKGVQSQHVGTSIKHFAANNQETRRFSVSARIDERTLHEIYLAAFEGAVQQAKPWTVMSSYNKVNGRYVEETPELMTGVLRDAWGFDGLVMSDWGAVSDRVAGLAAGLDLEMPGCKGVRDGQIVEAVQNGTLAESVVDTACQRIIDVAYRYLEHQDETAVFDLAADHEVSRTIARETMVLLKNEDGILPLPKDKKIAFIGKYADKPRFQGGGSSHINCAKVTSALDALKEAGLTNVTYAQGFDDAVDAVDETLQAEAVALAEKSDICVIFAGLPDAFESEGFDRSHMEMPACQNALINAVAAVNPNVVVVLHNGSPVEMPWVAEVKGILEAYLGGEACGGAVVDLLFGKANPSGKLAETFPIKLSDNPSYLTGFGAGNEVVYSEGIFVGYRYYEKKEMPVLFPFGHGLSYTEFAYDALQLQVAGRESAQARADGLDDAQAVASVVDAAGVSLTMKDTDTLTVSVDVTNTGAVAGKEVVQLYIRAKDSKVLRPLKELKGFEKVDLAPGETKTVTMTLPPRAFAYYEVKLHDFYVEGGEYEILAGKSSADICLAATVTIEASKPLPMTYCPDSILGDLPDTAEVQGIMKEILAIFDEVNSHVYGEDDSVAQQAITKEMREAEAFFRPIRQMISFSDGRITPEMVEAAVEKLNALQQA